MLCLFLYTFVYLFITTGIKTAEVDMDVESDFYNVSLICDTLRTCWPLKITINAAIAKLIKSSGVHGKHTHR